MTSAAGKETEERNRGRGKETEEEEGSRGRERNRERGGKQRKRREAGLQRRPERRQGAYEADGYTVDGGGRAGADGQELQVRCGRTPGGLEQPGGDAGADSREVRAAGGLEQGAASLRLRLCRQEAGPPPPPLFLSSLREAAAARTCGKSPRAGGLPRNSIYAVDSRPFPSSADATPSIPASFYCVRLIPRRIPSSSRLAAPASATSL